MRIGTLILLLGALAACTHKSNDGLRQGVVDHLTKAGLNVAGMDVNLTNVERQGDEADVVASISPRGGNPAQGMSFKYHLQQKGGQWVVVGRQESGAPHGGMAPGTENPHGAGAPPAAPGGAGSKMPSPEDLPPAGKKQ